jgi:hypothetical protein
VLEPGCHGKTWFATQRLFQHALNVVQIFDRMVILMDGATQYLDTIYVTNPDSQLIQGIAS